MKQKQVIVSIILTFVILFNSFHLAITYSYYYIDPVGFIEKLCENKDKPTLKCNGKCHLKKVAQDTNNEQKPISIKIFKEITLYVVKPVEYLFKESFSNRIKLNNYRNLYAYLSNYNFYHPPKI
ncbi:MAG: hypothetical protein Q8S44_04845 [Flavobacteriaceae bacterium]|nr:hypothetical protein [Flavobacteriaceae bacterium]